MTSKLVVNTIEADTGISSVSFASSISMDSTSKFHFSAAGVDIGADTNINRPAAGVLGFNISGAEKLRIDTNGHLNTSGIVTAANFKTGVTNLHSTGLTLTGGQLDVGSNIKVGTAGVITATSFVGSGANLTGISGVSVANQADNRLITVTGTTDALNGEANLTFDGTTLKAEAGNPILELSGTTSNGGNTFMHINANANHWCVGADNYTQQNLFVIKDGTPASSTHRFAINSSGTTLINTTTATGAAKLQLLQTSGDGLLVRNHDTNYEGIILSNASGEARLMATSGGSTSRPSLTFYAGDAERLRIDTTGLLGLNRTPVYSGLFGGSQKGMHIGGSTAPFLRITSDTSNQGDLVLHAGNSGADISMANLTAGGDIVFWNRPTGGSMQERLRIQDAGEFQLKPPGDAPCDLAFKLNNSNDSRINYYDSGGTKRGTFAFTEYSNSTNYPNFHDSFYLQTDPSSNGTLATAMRINNAGCVILPKQPCFAVAMSNDYSSATSHTANFDTERHDQGNNFNTGSNGIFTAPVTGKYYMHAVIQTRQGGSSQPHIMGVSFSINGSVQVSKGSGDQYWGRNGDHYMSVHCIRILDLAQGDTVQVNIQLHDTVYIEGSGGSDRSNWQGYLVA